VLGEFPLGPQPLAIGRAPGCEVKLDSLHVSARHAEVWRDPDGSARVRDLRSTNGTFVGGVRIEESRLAPDTELIVGPYFLRYTGASLLLFDTRGRTWVEARGIEHWIGDALLLDGISVALQPGEFVGLLGPSGAGKSMLLKALCGTLRASGGQVLVNGLDFYAQYAVLKTLVGYVPQDDIIHAQLTAADTLRYAAELRLSSEAGWLIRQARGEEVLSALGLQDRSQLPAWQLSGGQRKRLSIGVELLNEPNLLYLDEPTAGLDPNLEEKMMVLFRELALRGKIVCCVTHTLDHIELCDKIALLYGRRSPTSECGSWQTPTTSSRSRSPTTGSRSCSGAFAKPPSQPARERPPRWGWGRAPARAVPVRCASCTPSAGAICGSSPSTSGTP
jgi:ABC-type Mn2+/Zn2+ transport system ATPase subunit